nr:protein Spindly-B-like [Lytechinus pictus]
MDLEERIERLEQELKESEANGRTAASIGKHLLETNKELEQRNEDLITEHTKQIEELEQEKYSLQMQLVNKESMERHHASEIENLQERLKQESRSLKERLELEHSCEVQKVKKTCEGLMSDLELARIQNDQLKEQVTNLEDELEEARNRANITIMDMTMTSEEKLSTLQEEVINLTTEKVQLTSQVKEYGHQLDQLRFTNHKLKVRNEEVEGRAEEEHQQCISYSRSLQETHKQLEELQAELDLIKLESTDPNKKGNSLFAEVEDRRQAIEKKMISLQLHHDALQKQLNHKKQQVHGLKYQIAGLLQMDRGRVAAEQVERLEQMLSQSRGEVQTLTHKLQTLQNQQIPEFSANEVEGTGVNMNLDGLKRFYQSKLELAKKEKEQLKRELQTERTKRMSLEYQLIECQRTLYGTEREVQRIKAANVKITLKMDDLKSKLAENGIVVDKEVKGGYTEKIPIPEKFKKKSKESTEEKTTTELPGRTSEPSLEKSQQSTKTSLVEDREPLTEQKPNVSSANGCPRKDGGSKKKCVSIMEDVTVVDDEGSQTKRSVTEDEEMVELKKKQKREVGMKDNGEGSSRGKRGGRVVKNVPVVHVTGEKNECKQQ